jgi:uncharacterized protein (TIGR02996 family)
MPQTDTEPFLQRIRAFPDDDVPRLIFADWLDEQGDERSVARASFIRVQIALARLPEDDPRRSSLLISERALLDAHRGEWEAPFRGLAHSPVFRRGFVEEVKIAARQYLRQAHELFAAGPVRHLHLIDVGSSLPTVLQSSYLSRLAALTIFASHLGEPLARAVARCPHLSGLRALHLGRNRLADDAADHLAGSVTFANLEELDLSENELGETGARALAASPYLGKLRRLELRSNQLGPAGAEAVAGSERLASLHHLGLGLNEVGVSRLHSLSRVSDLMRVPSLDLSGNGLGVAGLKAILSRPPMPAEGPEPVRLRELTLSHNELGEDGARILAECLLLAGLTALRLAGCGIPDEGSQALAHSPHLGRLTALDLGNNPISDPGLRPFTDPSHLRSLRRLVYSPLGVSKWMQDALRARFARLPALG